MAKILLSHVLKRGWNHFMIKDFMLGALGKSQNADHQIYNFFLVNVQNRPDSSAML